MPPGRRRSNASTARPASSILPTPPLEETDHLLPQTVGENADSSLPKGVRGMALGLALEKATRGGRKVPLIFPGKKLRPAGNWAASFNSELGRCIRIYTDPSLDSWNEVPDVDKKHVLRLILEKFDVDITRENVSRGIGEIMMLRYSNWRYVLHQHYKTHRPNSIRNPPKNISQDKWERFCLRILSEKFQKRSEINIANRGHLTVNHLTGSKSFVQVRYEKRNPKTEMELDRVDFYKETYFNSSTGAWSCDKAEERYEAMVAMKSQPTPEGKTPLTADEICDDVLGKKSGYIRGLGHGEKPEKSSSSTSRFEVEEAIKRAEAFELRAQEAEKLAEDAEKRAEEANKRAMELDDRVSGVESLLQSVLPHLQPS